MQIELQCSKNHFNFYYHKKLELLGKKRNHKVITEIDKICILNTSREYLVSLQANISSGKWTNLAQPGGRQKKLKKRL